MLFVCSIETYVLMGSRDVRRDVAPPQTSRTAAPAAPSAPCPRQPSKKLKPSPRSPESGQTQTSASENLRPTSLAEVNNPEFESRYANDPQKRNNIDYMLGLRSRIEDCLGGGIKSGTVTVLLSFDNDPVTHESTGHGYDFSPRGTTLDEMQLRILSACLRLEHDGQSLRTTDGVRLEYEYGFGTQISFPIEDDLVYKLIK